MLERLEWMVRRLLAAGALGAAALAIPGVVASARERGLSSGRPELLFTPSRLALMAIGWLTAARLAWRRLPWRPGRMVRWLLLASGFAASVAGLALAITGRLALGASYRPSSTVGATLAPAHELVTDGPYGRVRHPMYLGLALLAVGSLAIYRTWTTLLFVAQLPVLVVRARREETLLETAFGDRWREYAAAVPAWLPRAWRSAPAT